jgi:hypothetical protein
MRTAQTLTVDKHAALFEHCDAFIDTDAGGWSLILANAKGRAAFDTVITRPRTPDWDFGKPLQSWLKEAPPDWRGIDLDFGKLERDGHTAPIPHFDGAPNIHPMTLRLGVAALLTAPDLRVIIHDNRAGIKRLNVMDGNKPVTTVVDYAGFREKLAHHRNEKVSRYLASNGKTFNDDKLLRRGVVVAIDDFIAAQKTALPGLPGGPPLVPSSPVVSFDNGRLSRGRDVLDRIARNGKAEPVVLQFGKPGSAFPTHIHLFELSPNICNSISGDDRKQMLADLQTAGLLHLPFNQIAVRFYLPDLVPKSDRKVLVTFCVSGALSIHTKDANLVSADKMFDRLAVQTLDGKTQIFSICDLTGVGGKDGIIDLRSVKAELATICLDALTTLVLALATRNVVKRTTENKRINNKHKQSKPQFRGPQGAIYLSSTVVEAPDAADMDDDPNHPAQEGTAKRPHMRRGHLHTVLHGVGRRERRVRWFPAVFVNADPTFVADARKYVVMP